MPDFCKMKISLQGKQPKVVIPPFYPDQAKPYLSESEAQSLFQRVDEIFHQTGNPLLLPLLAPLLIVPIGFYLIIGIGEGDAALYAGLIMILAPVILPAITMITITLILASKRKGKITEVIEQWNRTEGIPKGIYLALGSDNGISPDNFWLGIYPRRGRYGPNGTMLITIDNSK